jgi:acyl-CoA synthetase (AMP-forming)/AMP-acid ligase II
MTNLLGLAARPFMTVPDLIDIHAVDRPHRRALVQDDDELTYADLHRAMRRFASALRVAGVPQRGVVAILSATTVPAATAFLGSLAAGCVPAPIAPSSTPDQVAAMIADSGASIVFVDAEAAAVLPQVPATVVRLDRLDAWLDGAEHSADDSAARVTVVPSDPFNIIYSSGTTGTPKGIVHSHGTRWTQTSAFMAAGRPEPVTMVATPLYSNTTLITFLPSLALGGTVVLMKKFDARRFLESYERERATHTMLVPVQYQRIMEVEDFARFDLSSYEMKTCTSAPFGADLKADVVRRWPGALLEIYGMTEGGGTCLLLANAFPHKLHTVGQPAPGNDIRLIDDAGQEVQIGGVGEVVGRSGVMMTGYHGRPDVTSASEWFDAQGNRYIRHGDIGRFDTDGFLTLLGRTKDMIISGGFNVYPPDIEAVLSQHPSVSDCAVIGVPSEQWGETPFAFYVSKPGGVHTDDLVAWVNARVGKTQRISGARQIDALPRSPIGKILKKDLRDLYKTSQL